MKRLREFFAKRGVTVGASGLVVVLSANAVQAAPVGLAITISSAATALAGTAIAAAATATKAIAMTTLQKTIIVATLAVAVGTGVYKERQSSAMRDQVRALEQQQELLTEQNEHLHLESDGVRKELDRAREEVWQLRAGTNQADVLRLRSEVGMLRQATNELAKALQDNRRPAEQSLQLTPQDMFKLRRLHTTDAMSELLTALKLYADNHGGGEPMNLDDLKNSTGLSGTNFAGGLDLSDFMVLNPPCDFNGTRLILRNRIPILNPDDTGEWVYGGLDTNGVPSTITMGAQFGN